MTDRQLRLLALLTAIAVVLLAGSCLGAYFVGYQKGAESVEKQIDTLRIRQKIYIKQPPLLKEVPVPVPADVDTAAILAAHFAERIYSDTVRVPDVMTVILTDTLTQNTLTGRDFIYDIHLPTFRPSPTHAVSLGTAFRKDHYAISASYRHKRWTCGVGYEIQSKQTFASISYDIIQW